MRGIRKQSSDTQSSSQPKEKRRLDTKQKKGMLIGGGIFLVAVIALILVKNLTGGSGADGENVLYADSVGMITGTGLGTQNRFTGVVEAQDTLKLTLADNQKVKQIFVEKGQEVEPGTKLFEYDTEELAMTLDQGKLELEKITNNISSLNSQIATLTTEKKSAPASEQLSYTTQIQELQMEIKQEEYNYKVAGSKPYTEEPGTVYSNFYSCRNCTGDQRTAGNRPFYRRVQTVYEYPFYRKIQNQRKDQRAEHRRSDTGHTGDDPLQSE